jgi:AcrR family transcriptional regulator
MRKGRMDSFEASPFVRRPVQERSRAALVRIVSAATEVLARKGNDGFSMAEIADAAGMPIGNIYRRFSGKDSIVEAIKLDAIVRLEEIVRERLNGHSLTSAEQVVAELAETIATVSEQNEALHKVLYSYPIATPALRAIGLAGKGRVFDHYRRAILGFMDHLPEQRREIVAGISYQVVTSAFVAKSRGDDPILLEISWSALAQEVTKAAAGYLREVT